MSDFLEHPSRASAWRDNRFVVHPGAQAEDVTVWIPLQDGPAPWEGLLAQRTGPGTARICAVPLWAYNLNLGDEIKTIDSAEGAPVILELLHDAGQHAYRVRFEGAGASDNRWRELMKDLEADACWFDVLHPGFVAISAPAESAAGVERYLNRRTEAGELDYERGRQNA